MKRISTSTAVDNKFVDGNKATGQKATKLNAEWFNQLQEEICKLLEAAGITVGAGDADNQLMQLFTSLFVLQATLKSATCKKSFEGGYSTVAVDGEKIDMSASGESLTDNSSLMISRLLQKFQKSNEGGMVSSEISPTGLIVKAVGSDDTVLVEVKNGSIIFKSGNPLAAGVSIIYDQTNKNITVSSTGTTVFTESIEVQSGWVYGDVKADIIEPLTANAPVTIGSSVGGVELIGTTTGFKGTVQTNTINPINQNNAISIGNVAGGVNLVGRNGIDRLNLSALAYIKTNTDYSLISVDSSSIGVSEGDVVVLENTGENGITITMSVRAGTGGEELKQMTLNAYCAMSFICNGLVNNRSSWSPIGNVTVSWNTQGA